MRTTVLINAKGGTGKTTTTVNMAAELAARGENVRVIDADPQCNATDFLLPSETRVEHTLYDLMDGSLNPDEANIAVASRIKGVTLIPGDERLSLLDLAALQRRDVRMSAIRETIEAIAAYDDVSYILIDCPPGFTAATTAALAAADDIVIPMKIDAFSIRGEENLVRQINGMREFNPRLRVAGVLVTMNDPQTVVSKQGLALLRESAVPVFNTTISRATAVDKATFTKTPLRLLPEAEKVAKQYSNFIDEYLKGGAGRG